MRQGTDSDADEQGRSKLYGVCFHEKLLFRALSSHDAMLCLGPAARGD